MNRKRFPPKEGWMQFSFVMATDKPMSEMGIKTMSLIGIGQVEDYEWGKVEQRGKKIVVIRRVKVHAMNGKAVAA